MNRRIVTNGSIYRVQFQTSETNEWTFYSIEFKTRESAESAMHIWNERDKIEKESEWLIVND